MSTINSVVVSGRLAKDPIVREIRENLTAALITVCVSQKYRMRDGTEKEETCFVDCTLWNQEAKNAQKYLKKGAAVTVSGSLKQEKWEDKETGRPRSKHVIQVQNVMYMEKMDPNPVEGY